MTLCMGQMVTTSLMVVLVMMHFMAEEGVIASSPVREMTPLSAERGMTPM